MPRTGLLNLSGLDQFDKFVSLANFPVSKMRTTAHSFPLLPTYKPGTYRAVAPARFGKFSYGSLVSLLFLPAVYHGYSFNYSIEALPKRSLAKLLLVTIREHPPPREMPDLSIQPWRIQQPPVSCHQMHKKKITWKLSAAGGGADCL